MKAWQIAKHGGNEVLNRVDLPTPKPGAFEVLVSVKAVGLNHLDLWARKGVPGYSFPLPLIPGTDGMGIIAEFGAGAEASLKGLSIGSRVLISPGLSCGKCEACLGGFDPLCPEYGIIGETTNGACTGSIVVPVENIIGIPSSISDEIAASIGIPYLTAWTMIERKAKLRPGEWILIQAGGSGVSIAATQIAKLFGATVITTVGNDSKIEKSKAAGADYVINYKKTPFREELKKILKPPGKKGVDVVIDHVGADTFSESMRSLAWGGRLVTCGATTGGTTSIDLKALFFKNLSLLGSTMGSKADLLKVVDLIASGKLKPVVDRVLPMEKLGEALELIEGRELFGKIVLTQS